MTCDGFCDIAVATCKTEWPDKTACMTACATMKTTGKPYDATAAAATPADNIECRLYHLTVAATDAASAGTHCAHTALVSPVCK